VTPVVAESRVAIEGDRDLARHLLHAVAIIA
jgi:hypothetical protein